MKSNCGHGIPHLCTRCAVTTPIAMSATTASPSAPAVKATPLDVVARGAKATARFLYDNVLSYIIPKRRMVVRAAIVSALAMGPVYVALFIVAPLRMSLFCSVLAAMVYYFGLLDDVFKQLRWMKRTSSAGPIFWFAAWVQRMMVRLGRRYYGDKLDAVPVAPSAFGLKARGAKKVTFKWIPQIASRYSVEKYELQIRPTRGELPGFVPLPDVDDVMALNDDEISPWDMTASPNQWIPLADDVAGDELILPSLIEDLAYEARVRSVNSKGASNWIKCSFRTKQMPLTSDDGHRAGGHGPGYTWMQHLKDETIVVTVGPLPAGTRAKMLDVKVTPTALSIKVLGGSTTVAPVEGELFKEVKADEIEWELNDIKGENSSGGARELILTLIKAGKLGDGPFWPCLIKGHPDVDVSGLKREEKSLEELMAEINADEAASGMKLAQDTKQKLGLNKKDD